MLFLPEATSVMENGKPALLNGMWYYKIINCLIEEISSDYEDVYLDPN